MKNNSFDSSVKQKLEGHEALVPTDAWANIQHGKKKRKPWPFFWLLGGLVLCGGMSVYFLNDQNTQEESLRETVSSDAVVGAEQKLPTANGVNNMLPNDTNTTSTRNAASNNSIAANDQRVKKTTANAIILPNKNLNTVIIRSKDALPKRSSFKDKKDDKDLVKMANTGDADETIYADKKVMRSIAGKFKMTVKAAETEEENPAGKDGHNNELTEMVVDRKEMIPSAGGDGKDSIPVSFLAGIPGTDSLSVAAAQQQQQQQPGKKKSESGLSFAFSLSTFSPLSNFDKPSSIRRTIETAMNRAEFIATDISIRQQTSISFNALIKKRISGKTQVGGGLSYTVIKEYIGLKGEETNTVLSVIKRLQNGNQLVNDTIAVTSTGIRSIDAVNSYHFLSIPLSIQYQLVNSSRWEMSLQAGLDISIYSKYKNEIAGKLVPQYASANSVPERNKGMGIGFNSGLNIERRLGKRYNIFAAPYLQFNPTKIYLQGMPAAGKIGRAGIGLGINYRL